MAKDFELNIKVSGKFVSVCGDWALATGTTTAGLFLTFAPGFIAGRPGAEIANTAGYNAALATMAIGAAMVLFGGAKLVNRLEPCLVRVRKR